MVDAVRVEIKNLISESYQILENSNKSDNESENRINCLSKYELAYQKLKEIKDSIDKSTYDRAEYTILYNLVTLNLLCANADNAKKYINKLKANALTNNVYNDRNRELGYLYLKLASLGGDNWGKFELINSAFELFSHGDIKDEDLHYICLSSVILATNANQNHDPMCKTYAERAAKHADSIVDPIVKAKIFSDLSTVYFKDTFDTSNNYLKRALDLLEEAKKEGKSLDRIHRVEAVVYQNFGALYNIHNKFEQAYEMNLKAIEIIENQINHFKTVDIDVSKSKDKQNILNLLEYQLGNTKFNLGYSAVNMQKYDEAEKLFKTAYDKGRQTGIVKNQLECLEALSAVYSHLNDIKNRNSTIERALDLCKRNQTNSEINEIEKRLSSKNDEIKLRDSLTLKSSLQNGKPINKSDLKKEGGSDNDDGDSDDDEFDEFSNSRRSKSLVRTGLNRLSQKFRAKSANNINDQQKTDLPNVQLPEKEYVEEFKRVNSAIHELRGQPKKLPDQVDNSSEMNNNIDIKPVNSSDQNSNGDHQKSNTNEATTSVKNEETQKPLKTNDTNIDPTNNTESHKHEKPKDTDNNKENNKENNVNNSHRDSVDRSKYSINVIPKSFKPGMAHQTYKFYQYSNFNKGRIPDKPDNEKSRICIIS